MDTFRNLQMAVVAAAMDAFSIAEFAAINYGARMVGPAISGIAPPGVLRTLLEEGVTAASEIAKLIVFTANQGTLKT